MELRVLDLEPWTVADEGTEPSVWLWGQTDRPGCCSLLLGPTWGIESSPKCKKARAWGLGKKGKASPGLVAAKQGLQQATRQGLCAPGETPWVVFFTP